MYTVCDKENILLIADPKAIQYIFQTRAYNYVHPPARHVLLQKLMGDGLLASEGMFASPRLSCASQNP
jgi:hypothetical protein